MSSNRPLLPTYQPSSSNASSSRTRYNDDDDDDDYATYDTDANDDDVVAEKEVHFASRSMSPIPLRGNNMFQKSLLFLYRKYHWFRHLSWDKRAVIITLTIIMLFTLFWHTFSSCSIRPSFLHSSSSSSSSSTSFSSDSSSLPTAWMDPRERQLIETQLIEMRSNTGGSKKHLQDMNLLSPSLVDAEILTYRRYPKLRMLEYGSGYSTFHFSKFVDEYYSIEHDLEYCSKLFTMSEEHGNILPNDLEIYRLQRDATGGILSTRWDENRPKPIKPRIRIYCIAPSSDEVRTEERSYFLSW